VDSHAVEMARNAVRRGKKEIQKVAAKKEKKVGQITERALNSYVKIEGGMRTWPRSKKV